LEFATGLMSGDFFCPFLPVCLTGDYVALAVFQKNKNRKKIYDRKKIKIFPFPISDLGTPSGIYKWDQKLSPAKCKRKGGVIHAQR